MTPDSPPPESSDRLPRLSLRAVVLGAVGVLAAGTVVALAGFLSAPTTAAGTSSATSTDTQSGQLDTLPLHDEKPMKHLGKGVPGVTPTSSSTPTPSGSTAP